ncbi:MAG: putative oxidoreductase [Solirubrobacteraceae bacterium]|jgi:putative oxidoreductase|nr:putative oxidoreductase [Solirubrobacteraceae bacterium]
MNIGVLILRVVLGALFIGHGTQKLFGWFGGHGLDGTAGFFEKLGLHPPRQQALATGAAEAGGGALLLLGLFTPLATASISGAMAGAIKTVHAPNGPWVTDNGYEYQLVIIAAMAAIADTGPGDVSLDHALGLEAHGPFWAIASVGAGIAAATYLIDHAQRHAPAPAAQQTPGDPANADPAPARAAA